MFCHTNHMSSHRTFCLDLSFLYFGWACAVAPANGSKVLNPPCFNHLLIWILRISDTDEHSVHETLFSMGFHSTVFLCFLFSLPLSRLFFFYRNSLYMAIQYWHFPKTESSSLLILMSPTCHLPSHIIGQEEPLHIGSWIFFTWFCWSLIAFLSSSLLRYFRLSLYISALDLGSAISPRNPGFL